MINNNNKKLHMKYTQKQVTTQPTKTQPPNTHTHTDMHVQHSMDSSGGFCVGLLIVEHYCVAFSAV